MIMRRLLDSLLHGLLEVYDHLVIYFGVIWLGVLCTVWTPFALLINPLLPARYARSLGRFVTMVGFRIYLASLSLSRRFSFDMKALDALRGEPSLIIAPNHPCLLDALIVISRLPNVACVLKSELMSNVFLGAGARMARYIRNDPAREMVLIAAQDFESGSHLLLFPEGTRTTADPVNPLTASIGVIARQAQVPVQTVLIETDSKYLSKGWTLFRKPPMPLHYRVRLGRRFDPPPIGQTSQDFMAELEHYFAHELVRGSAFYPPNSLPAQPAQGDVDASESAISSRLSS
jgi:1-acyl-sn-glycerol-3-phosphate acyltransferase